MAANGMDDLFSDILGPSSSDDGIRAPLLGDSQGLDSSDSCPLKSDPFSRSLSIKRNLKKEKIYSFEAFAHFLKGNIGSGYTVT